MSGCHDAGPLEVTHVAIEPAYDGCPLEERISITIEFNANEDISDGHWVIRVRLLS